MNLLAVRKIRYLAFTLMVSVCATAAYAIDECNPYVQKTIQQEIRCSISEFQQMRGKDSRVDALTSAFIKSRQELLDALDANLITPKQAATAFRRIQNNEAELAKSFMSAEQAMPSPPAPSLPATTTCRNDPFSFPPGAMVCTSQ